MPNPKTIKEIESEVHIKWLSKAITVYKNTPEEMTVLPYGYLSQAVNQSLLSLLDEVESKALLSAQLKLQYYGPEAVHKISQVIRETINDIKQSS